MNILEKAARERHKILWDYYNENGSITTQDCYRLLGVKAISWIRETFITYGLEMPPRIDRPIHKYKELADKLNDAAKERGVTELTSDEMGEILGRENTTQVSYVRQQCKIHGYEIPRLKVKDAWRKRMLERIEVEKKDRAILLDEYLEIEDEYPEGLQVMSIRIELKNRHQVIYMLK